MALGTSVGHFTLYAWRHSSRINVLRNCSWFILLLLLQACQSSNEQSSASDVATDSTMQIADSTVSTDLIWHFESEFEPEFKDTLKLWVNTVKEACFETLGDYPFTMNIFFHKSDSRQKEGVTFGHTDRAPSTRGLHLYVIDQSSYESLISDWIAPHEMSHLAIRPVGRNNKWFAEGFATYLSRRIMIRLGYYSEVEFEEMYAAKIAATKPFYEVDYSFSDRSAELFEEYRYSTVYWAGAGFFYWADKELQKNSNMRFEELLQEYQIVGRNQDTNFAQLIKSWDEIAGYKLFDQLMSEYRNGSSREIMNRF